MNERADALAKQGGQGLRQREVSLLMGAPESTGVGMSASTATAVAAAAPEARMALKVQVKRWFLAARFQQRDAPARRRLYCERGRGT